jgi:hypothetical protein
MTAGLVVHGVWPRLASERTFEMTKYLADRPCRASRTSDGNAARLAVRADGVAVEAVENMAKRLPVNAFSFGRWQTSVVSATARKFSIADLTPGAAVRVWGSFWHIEKSRSARGFPSSGSGERWWAMRAAQAAMMLERNAGVT